MTADEARAALLQLITGFATSQAIHVAATLSLADFLGGGPKTAADLAEGTKTNPVALYRLMRALASIGVFEEDKDRRFSLTTIGQFLRSEIAGTHAPMAQLVGRPNVWQAWGHLLLAVRTGVPAFDQVHGNGVWDYRAQHPDEAGIFDRAMASGTERFADAVLNVCDFGRFDRVVDVGGGNGMFLVKMLAAYPHIQGTLFDQPHVVAQSAAQLNSTELSGRCHIQGGSFFVNVPEGADAYLLKWILHDWDDMASIDILRSCRKAMKSTSLLFVVEHVIGPPNASPEGKFMDLAMMVMNGGRERTRDEFANLFAEAGFRLTRVTPTATAVSVLEGVLKSD
jgi:hypothetical protein